MIPKTVTQLSIKYPVSARTIRRWIRQRKIVGRKIGNSYLVDEKSLKEYLVRQRS